MAGPRSSASATAARSSAQKKSAAKGKAVKGTKTAKAGSSKKTTAAKRPAADDSDDDDDTGKKFIPGTTDYATKCDPHARFVARDLKAWQRNAKNIPKITYYIGWLMILPNHAETDFPKSIQKMLNDFADPAKYPDDPIYAATILSWRSLARDLVMPDDTTFHVPNEGTATSKTKIKLWGRVGNAKEVLPYRVYLDSTPGISQSASSSGSTASKSQVEKPAAKKAKLSHNDDNGSGIAEQSTSKEQTTKKNTSGSTDAAVSGDVQAHDTAVASGVQAHDTAVSGDVQAHDTAVSGDVQAHDTAVASGVQAQDAAVSGDVQAHDAAVSGDVQAHNAAVSGDVQAHDAAVDSGVQAQDAADGGDVQAQDAADDSDSEGDDAAVSDDSEGDDLEDGDAAVGGDVQAHDAADDGASKGNDAADDGASKGNDAAVDGNAGNLEATVPISQFITMASEWNLHAEFPDLVGQLHELFVEPLCCQPYDQNEIPEQVQTNDFTAGKRSIANYLRAVHITKRYAYIDNGLKEFDYQVKCLSPEWDIICEKQGYNWKETAKHYRKSYSIIALKILTGIYNEDI
ncbi:hypothetical protein ANO14919_021920 [Xylariales sp. No.14919]|nr:hypothetical protein ANO14919_021920 [Xylariales sp. No.14919]